MKRIDSEGVGDNDGSFEVEDMEPTDWIKEARRLRARVSELEECLNKFYKAMIDYEMDVDADPPMKHTMMMEQARALLFKDATDTDDGSKKKCCCGETDDAWRICPEHGPSPEKEVQR